ncbi:MAG: hypothetical protein AAB610_02290 [Patescibacteria group bacterium]
MFSLEKYNLQENLDEPAIRQYSAFKLGDVDAIKYYSELLIDRLKSILNPNEKYILYTTNKSPTNNFCKKNSLLALERASSYFNIPLVIGEYTFSYSPETFYDNNISRKTIHIPYLKKADELKILGHNVIFFDDSIVSGLALKTSCDILKGLTTKILFFSGIDLTKGPYIEKDFNNYYFETEGVAGLVKIIGQQEYVFTTQMMRTMGALQSEHIQEIFEKISSDKKDNFLKAYALYFGYPYNL